MPSRSRRGSGGETEFLVNRFVGRLLRNLLGKDVPDGGQLPSIVMMASRRVQFGRGGGGRATVCAACSWTPADTSNPATTRAGSGTRGSGTVREAGQRGKRDRSDIVKLGGPADVRAIFTRARHFDFGPPFAGDPWDDRPTLGPNVARFPSAIPAGQRGGLVARCGEALPVPARRRFD